MNTRDELGFEMDGAGEDVDEDWSSHDERIVGDCGTPGQRTGLLVFPTQRSCLLETHNNLELN